MTTLPAGDVDWTNLDDAALDRIAADPNLTARYVALLRAEAEDLAARAGWDKWRLQARPEQIPPPGRWRVWYLRGGRGGGKTWTGANALAELIRRYPVDTDGNPTEWGVVAPTIADARDTCIENNRSGLLKALGLSRNYKGWNRSQGQLHLPSGQIVYTGAADDGADRMQGKNLSGCWCDEVGLWERWETAWREGVQMTVRVAPARIIATGTPKAERSARELVAMLLEDPDVPKSQLRTVDNAANLDPHALAEFQRLEGTRLGRQELEGDLLEELLGQVFRRSWWQFHHGRDWGKFNVIAGTHSVAPASRLAQSWDLTFKDGVDVDYVVGQVWEFDGANAYLVDQVRDRMDFVATCAAVQAMKAKWPQTGPIWVEEKANGAAVIAQLRRQVPGLIPVIPHGTKEARAAAVSWAVQSGNVHVPHPDVDAWVGDFLDEVSAFPGGRHDDQVDAMTQALSRLFLPEDERPEQRRRVVTAGRWAATTGRR